MKPPRPKLRIADAVTRVHAERYTAAWFQWSWNTSSMFKAFEETHLVRWPQDGPGQEHYHDLEDEIVEKTFEAVREAITEAFERVAGEILARERAASRPPRRKRK